ncbi:MAG: hypothetical protein IPM25_08335 [Chloracidobacterium sp.]|nr:hypothetical protein [Chloracidobacterium sp.]
MIKRMVAFSCLCLLVLNLSGSTVALNGDVKKARSASADLVAMLPASDGVVTLDVKRFFSDALPKILASNQPAMDKVVSAIDKMKARTGIDVRQFDHVAAGVTARKLAEKKYDIEPVIVARGPLSSAGVIDAAKATAKDQFREEKAGIRTIYIFEAQDLVDQTAKDPGAKDTDLTDKVLGKLSKEIAVSGMDANTIVFGQLELVRKAVLGQSKVSAELTTLLNKRPLSVVNFAAKMPAGMSAFLPLDDDDLGKNVESIRFLYGSMDMAGDSVAMAITARTLQAAQAKALLETLEGLQLIGKAFIGGVKGPERQVYARLIDNAKFSAKGNEVAFELQVPQSDIEILVGMLK